MTDQYTYDVKRGDVGKPINLTNSKNILKIGILPDEENEKLKQIKSD